MRDSCTGCPCLEQREKPWCFYYDRLVEVEVKDGCGNDFDEKPEFNQEELEDIIYDPKYQPISSEQLDIWFDEGEEGKEKISKAVEEAKKRFRQANK